MRNPTENLAINTVRTGELKQRDASARKIIERAARPLLSDENLEIFIERFGDRDRSYSRSRVLADIRYTQQKRERIRNSGQRNPILPHAVEYLVKGWLDSGQFFDTGLSPYGDPPAVRTHDYDDYANGADVVKTVNLPEDGLGHQRSLTMAFDVTISSNESVIGDKLRQYDNGLPYGFTRVKYYAEKQRNSKKIAISPYKKLVPRFVIGESATNIEATLKDKLSQNMEGYLKNDTPDSVLTRFKLLSEIYSQAILFLEKVPEDNDRHNKQAAGMLRSIVAMTEKRLVKCVEKMTPRMISAGNGVWAPTYADPEVLALPKSDIDKLKSVDRTGEAAVIIRNSLRNKDSLIYDEVYDKIMSEVENIDAKNPGKMPAKAKRAF